MKHVFCLKLIIVGLSLLTTSMAFANTYSDWFTIAKIETGLDTDEFLIHPVGGAGAISANSNNNPANCGGNDAYALVAANGDKVKIATLMAAFARKAEFQVFLKSGSNECALGFRPIAHQILIRYP